MGEIEQEDPVAIDGAGCDEPGPRSVLSGLRTLFGLGATGNGEIEGGQLGSGTEEPAADIDAHPWVVLDRTFAFVDISGFTSLCELRGPHEALDLLTDFRAVTREVTARRGVRVAKWLGDGVMLVSPEAGPAVATVAELLERMGARGVDLHAGIAVGEALLFEGDDYVGRAVNIAARLGSAAGAGEVLAWGVDDAIPAWVRSERSGTLALAGVGDLEDALLLTTAPEVAGRLRRAAA